MARPIGTSSHWAPDPTAKYVLGPPVSGPERLCRFCSAILSMRNRSKVCGPCWIVHGPFLMALAAENDRNRTARAKQQAKACPGNQSRQNGRRRRRAKG
jgi:hypothetical protein